MALNKQVNLTTKDGVYVTSMGVFYAPTEASAIKKAAAASSSSLRRLQHDAYLLSCGTTTISVAQLL